MNAAVHRDFKKMLAYCTIENIGIIGIGIGLGLIGIGKGQSHAYLSSDLAEHFFMCLTIHYSNHCFFFQPDQFTARHIPVIWINWEDL